jgi:hypothetical protein
VTEVMLTALAIAFVASSFFCVWEMRRQQRKIASEKQEHARAHRIVMDLAAAYEMPDNYDKALTVRDIKVLVLRYAEDARSKPVEQEDFAEMASVLSFSKAVKKSQ